MKTYSTASTARRALKNALASRNLSLDEVQFEIVPEFGNDGMFVVRVSVEIEGFEFIDMKNVPIAEEYADMEGADLTAETAEAEAIAEVEDAKSDDELQVSLAEIQAAVAAKLAAEGSLPVVDTTALESEVAATEANAQAKRGRPSRLAGKRITAVVTSNVRRPGSLGHATLALVLANPGATYEELVAMGATPGQLRHDEALQRIKAE